MSAAETAEPGHDAIVSLGSNIEPEANLPKALDALKQRTRVIAVSSIWQGPAIGSNAPDFLNAAVRLRTPLSADALKDEILTSIEDELGRRRTADKFAPRTIDLDIVIFDGKALDGTLWELDHLAIPIAQIYPDFGHPNKELTLSALSERLDDHTPLHRVHLP